MNRLYILLMIATLAPGCSGSGDSGDAGGTDTGSGSVGGEDSATGDNDTSSAEAKETDTPEDTGVDTGTSTADTESETGGGDSSSVADSETGSAADTESESESATSDVEDTSSDTLPSGDTGDGGDGPADGGADTGEADTGEWVDAGICDELDLFIERRTARAMILEDRSLSMREDLDEGTKWDVAVNALDDLLTTFEDDIQFGLDVFTAIDSEDFCTVGTEVVSDVAPGNAANIMDIMENQVYPANATPLLLAMQNFTDPQYAPTFLDGTGDSYLIIVSDGQDTCGLDGDFNQNGYDVADEMAAVTAQLLDDFNIKTYVIGFGEGIDADQLNAIAAAGGTGRDTFYDAANSEELHNVLNEIGETVAVTCTYEIGEYDEEEVNLDYVNISFDDIPIPRDDDCADGTGWTWTDETRTQFEFCEAACDALTGSSVEHVSVTIACNPDDVVIVI